MSFVALVSKNSQLCLTMNNSDIHSDDASYHWKRKDSFWLDAVQLGYYSNQFSRHWLSLLKSQMCSIKSPFCSSALFEDVSGISPSTTMASCTSPYSVLLTFMAAKILSDERQIGPRLEKEIEMYCSNKALERLKDMVDAPAKARRSSSGANGNDILHKYRDFFATYFPLFRRPKFLRKIKTRERRELRFLCEYTKVH